MSFDAPQSRGEATLQNMLGAENALEPPQSRVEDLLQQLLESGGGGEVTAAAVATAIGNMNADQKNTTRTNLVVDKSATVETISGTTATIAAAANTIYKCGELTALTISSIPESGEFTVMFTSGSTATVLTKPSGMILPDDFSVEANRRYEISVSDGYAVVASWEASA